MVTLQYEVQSEQLNNQVSPVFFALFCLLLAGMTMFTLLEFLGTSKLSSE